MANQKEWQLKEWQEFFLVILGILLFFSACALGATWGFTNDTHPWGIAAAAISLGAAGLFFISFIAWLAEL